MQISSSKLPFLRNGFCRNPNHSSSSLQTDRRKNNLSYSSRARCTADQSNLTEDGVVWQVHPAPRLYSQDVSIRLTVWLQFAIACFAWGWTLKSLLPCRARDVPYLTQCVIGPHKSTYQMTSKSVERFKQRVRMLQTDDRQTDHATEKCEEIAGIACVARAILPKNYTQGGGLRLARGPIVGYRPQPTWPTIWNCRHT